MNKNKLLALLLVAVLVVGVVISLVPVVMAAGAEDENSIVLNKTATENGDTSDILLTLESYVTGEATTITKTKPADIVLVIDQSASMYAPMGALGGKTNDNIYTPTSEESVTQYSEEDFLELSQTDPDFFKKAAQLGYFVAQSHAGGYGYCTNAETGHRHSDEKGCRSYDWFVIQYVPNDPDGLHWHFYRVEKTPNPSNDSLVTSIEDGKVVKSHEASIWKRADLNAVLNGSTFVFYKSQFGALYDAISSFSEGIIEADVGHRLAVVGFASEIDSNIYREGSGIYVNGQYRRYNTNEYSTAESRRQFTTWDSIYDADTLTSNDYKEALMTASPENRNNVMASINAVKSDYYGTNQDVGLDMANKIFAANPIEDEERDRIVILFTDGTPSPTSLAAYTSSYATKEDGVRDAILDQAYKAKNTYNAQVYTIWTSTLGINSDFIYYTSSDYPNAKSMTDYGTQITSPKYASGATTGEDLLNAFSEVLEDVSSTTVTELKSDTIVRDVIAPSFTLPEELVAELEKGNNDVIKQYIKVYESTYLGNGEFAKEGQTGYTEFSDAVVSITKKEDGLYQIDVTNYNFSENYVTDLESGGYRGAKLVIQIPIDVKPDFLGGDNVVTNTTESGIYLPNKDESIEAFPVPKVDVTVKEIVPEFKDGAIYVSQAAVIPHIANIGQYKDGDTIYVIDGINNAYVDIVYTISDGTKSFSYTVPAGTKESELKHLITSYWKDAEGNSITDEDIYKQLTEDTQYAVICTVTSTGNDENTEVYTANPVISVYKPEITFQDSVMNLGETADYETENYVKIVWKHGNDVADVSVMGEAPQLQYVYSPAEGAFTQETTVQITSVISLFNTHGNHRVPENTEIIDYVTFYRDACSYDDCTHKTLDEVTSGEPNFVVHLNTFDLTISKTGAQDIDENQSFIFRIKDEMNHHVMDVVIVGNGSVTIKGLPAGVYTVTEITDWSWRYTPDAESKTASAANAINGVTTVSFSNTREEDQWLTGDNFWKNIFNSSAPKPAPNPTPTEPAE